MIRLARPLSVCFVLIATAAALWSQTVRWEPPTGTLAINQTSEIQLVFDGCEPKENPTVPTVNGLQLQSVGQSSNMSIVNGVMTQSVTISFHVRSNLRGLATIPEFMVKTNKGPIRVAPASYEVGDATIGQGNVALDSVANSKIDVPQQVWAGEVFKVEYAMTVGRRYFHSPGSNQPDWNSTPLAVEEWSKPEVQEMVVGGEPRISILYRTRGYAKQAGQLTLNSASQLVNLSTGTQSFGFFARPNLEQFAITSSRPALLVKELPAGAPSSFNGAVGQFKLDSKVIPASSAVGEPITWTLALNGTGNWPDIPGLPARDVSRDFRVVQPQARRAMRDGTLFDGSLTEDVVLIPTQPGNYTLGPITWCYFDPMKGQYQTVTTEKVAVTVVAAQTQPTGSTAGGSTGTTGEGNSATTGASPGNVKPTTPPAAPQAIPRDALPGADSALMPWDNRVFTVALLAPIPLLLALWLGLAWRRAQVTDPFRRQREAQSRIRATLRELRTTTDRKRVHTLLQSWQRDVATLWQLNAAVPAVSHFRTVDKNNPTWPTLWSEAERALYRADGTLPPDWTTRAEAALQAKAIPAFSVGQLFRGRNLLPFAAAVLLTFLALPQLHAEDGKSAYEAYERGDFGTAEKSWRKTISENPTDWIARHNLALALAQQSRWGEAVGYAASSFVQHPRNASVQWHLGLTGDRAGFSPGTLSGFLNPTPQHSVARLCSPAEWQRLLVGAVALTLLGLAAFLLQSYGYTGRWSTPVGLVMIGLAVATGIIGSLSLGLYQDTRDTRAALVWKPSLLRSIPTEADTTQKTSPLAPGTIAVINKTYLGWSRLVFPNGQTGWIRQEDLVRLWQ